MWGGLGGLADKAGEFLKNLDETLSDEDEQYSGDEQGSPTPVKEQAAPAGQQVEEQGSADDLFGKPAPADATPPAQAPTEKKSQEEEIKKLQEQLGELKTEREDLKVEVASQLKGFTSEMTQSIGSLAAANATPAPPPDKIDASLKAQLQQAEEKLAEGKEGAKLLRQEGRQRAACVAALGRIANAPSPRDGRSLPK